MTLDAALEGPVEEAARALLGRRLVSDVGGRRCEVLVDEVEAYGGASDPASHAHRGPTRRNASMFGPAGRWYVYRSYGIHWCMNVVTGPAGEGAAVLLRGGRPVAGIEVMAGRRGRDGHLADGPGKLCQALGVTGALGGASVWEGPVRFSGDEALPGDIAATPRVGISRAAERPWRFTWQPSG